MSDNKKRKFSIRTYRRTVSPRLLFFLLILSVLHITACTPKSLSKEELIQHIADEDNGLSKSQVFKDFQLKVSYRPTDLLVLNEIGDHSELEQNDLETLRKKYQDHHYFTLSISKAEKEALYSGVESYEQFGDLVQTLSYRMGNYVNLTTSQQDTVFIADYAYQRTYGMNKATQLLFVFPDEELENPKWVQFNLKEFGLGLGIQNFRFNMQDLSNAPNLKLNQLTKAQ